jgi:hypothetical protein
VRGAARRELAHGLHDRRELGNGAAAEIVAIGEPAGQNDGVHVTEAARIVPDELRLLAEGMAGGIERVVIAIAAGKDDYAKLHDKCFGEANTYFSIGAWGSSGGWTGFGNGARGLRGGAGFSAD